MRPRDKQAVYYSLHFFVSPVRIGFPSRASLKRLQLAFFCPTSGASSGTHLIQEVLMKNNYKKLQKKEIISVLCPSESSPGDLETELIFNFRTTDISECNERIASRIQKLRRIKPELDWCYCNLYSETLSKNFQPALSNFAFCLCLRSDNSEVCTFTDIFHRNFNRYVSMLKSSCAAKHGRLVFDTRADSKKWIIEFLTILSTVLSIASNSLENEQSYDIFEKLADFAWKNIRTIKQDLEFGNEQFASDFIARCQEVLNEELIAELKHPKAFFQLRCKNSGNFPVNRILSELGELGSGVYTILFLAKKPKTKQQINLAQTVFEISKLKINTFIIYNNEKYLKNRKSLGLIAHLIGEYRIKL